jgi:hypothetical protein
MKEIINFIEELSDYIEGYWSFKGFVDEPEGVKQTSDCDLFEYEWVDQYGSDDSYHGFMYFPMGDRYLKIEYYI